VYLERLAVGPLQSVNPDSGQGCGGMSGAYRACALGRGQSLATLGNGKERRS
jgi:hypothetical protein